MSHIYKVTHRRLQLVFEQILIFFIHFKSQTSKKMYCQFVKITSLWSQFAFLYLCLCFCRPIRLQCHSSTLCRRRKVTLFRCKTDEERAWNVSIPKNPVCVWRGRVTETSHPLLFLNNLLFINDLDGGGVRYRRISGIFTVNMSTM